MFKLSAVGDISFQGRYSDNPKYDIVESVMGVLKYSDIVVANLENPLIESGIGAPSVGKCTLRGGIGWADVIKESGITVVSLANNHMMDYGEDGLFSTIDALDRAGVKHVGVGKNRDDAGKPLFLEVSGCSIAFLARSSVVVNSRCYAGDDTPGVAFLDVQSTIEMVRDCKKNADYVILILHWGLENYEHPSPEQRRLSKQFIDSGVDLILGHHPHVIQGVEAINNSVVNYSSGNFIFDEFPWSFLNMDGELQDTVLRMREKNRQGMILNVEFYQPQLSWHCIHTRITRSGIVVLDDRIERQKQFEALCQRLDLKCYAFIWKLYAAWREFDLRILPLVRGKFTWNKIKKIRPSHFKQLFSTLKRSLKITSEKTTNPYE